MGPAVCRSAPSPACRTARVIFMKRMWPGLLSVCLALVVWTSVVLPAALAADTKNDQLDWPYWRGPEYNSISRETGLPDSVNPEGGDGSNLAWTRKDLGGRSTPI